MRSNAAANLCSHQPWPLSCLANLPNAAMSWGCGYHSSCRLRLAFVLVLADMFVQLSVFYKTCFCGSSAQYLTHLGMHTSTHQPCYATAASCKVCQLCCWRHAENLFFGVIMLTHTDLASSKVCSTCLHLQTSISHVGCAGQGNDSQDECGVLIFCQSYTAVCCCC